VQQSLVVIDQPVQLVDIHKTSDMSKFHWLKNCNKNKPWANEIPNNKIDEDE
jgi:hypothetical protein